MGVPAGRSAFYSRALEFLGLGRRGHRSALRSNLRGLPSRADATPPLGGPDDPLLLLLLRHVHHNLAGDLPPLPRRRVEVAEGALQADLVEGHYAVGVHLRLHASLVAEPLELLEPALRPLHVDPEQGEPAAMAVDALGAEHVHAVMLPSRYTSQSSLDDASACAVALGIRFDTVPIAPPVEAVETVLSDMFVGTNADITEENIQSRLRGTLLMAVSNKFGSMVVTTGNKSEVSVGYATLYGDMNGGYNPIKDIYKTEVFKLAHWRNAHIPETGMGPAGVVIPETIMEKPPSAELRPDQKDEDSLPPYEALDDILFCLVEDELGVDEIVARGHAKDVVRRIEHLLYVSEYKRRQAAPGAKIGARNFGRDRRYPITNGFRDALTR